MLARLSAFTRDAWEYRVRGAPGGKQSDCGFRIASRSFQRSSARHEGFVLALYTSVWQKTVSRAMAFRTLKSFFPTVDELLQQDLPTLGEVSTHAPEKL